MLHKQLRVAERLELQARKSRGEALKEYLNMQVGGPWCRYACACGRGRAAGMSGSGIYKHVGLQGGQGLLSWHADAGPGLAPN